MSETNLMCCETVALDDADSALVILNQAKLPGEVEYLRLREQRDIWNAIRQLQVRGAPAIGVAAGFSIYLAAKGINSDEPAEFMRLFREATAYLNTARPTAVNLGWALSRMEQVVLCHPDASVGEIKELLYRECVAIRDEDIWMSRQIGEYGLSLLEDGWGILTHCNAGQLATTRYGTALAPIHLGRERGMRFRVVADETRPLLQGARLTASELVADGVETTLICDNMASQVMKNGWVQAVLVGCDRVAANGDTCNKIGTSGVAILAKYYGIPFFVLGPTSSIDMNIANGGDIPIEQRPAEEVTEMWYAKRMAPQGVSVYNPAFDVTDHTLITAIVTEYGIARPPYAQSLREIFQKKRQARGT
jgi:methylthioribose-1-phosphate isomerase